MFFHKILDLPTRERECFVDITGRLRVALAEEKVGSGILLVSSPHTTAGITINENADPDVPRDMTTHLKKMVPEDPRFHHSEGNSDAHIKTALLGTCTHIPVIDGKLILGTWQGIFFCEFDGPRRRKVHLTFTGDSA